MLLWSEKKSCLVISLKLLCSIEKKTETKKKCCWLGKKVGSKVRKPKNDVQKKKKLPDTRFEHVEPVFHSGKKTANVAIGYQLVTCFR